ncbi:DedA family protein [Acidimangrovimonas pyrenivorans]|uniref:DedA family protein n=1 Tax=Acidimangrovimonas pyrenivorans TaxID=2030798 RepID=A0ABV7AEQ0_9RHOB
MGLDTVIHLIQTHGLLLLAPIAVLEGPIVTVIASYLARLGYMDIYAVFVVVVLADLVGDAIFYELGRAGPRFLPARWLNRIGLSEDRLEALTAHFRYRGGRTLVIGKLTHSAGMLVLVAAGASRMNFGLFLWYNLLGTVPKSLFFAVIGYSLGFAYTAIDGWIFRGSILLLILLILGGIWWVVRHRRRWT